MAKRLERTRNTTDVSVTFTISVDQNVAVTAVVANPKRIRVVISNPHQLAFWVRERTAISDNNKDGEKINSGGVYKTDKDNPYTGEISVIMAVGGFKTLTPVER